jgi:guanylate kinase
MNIFAPYTKPLFIISAPSGTGKTTIVRMLIDAIPELKVSISTTTRQPRGVERNGIDYHFISQEQFLQEITKGSFLEHAQIYGHYYGTSLQAIQDLEDQGNYVLLEIDTQGADEIQKRHHAVSIFISPPSIQELEKRLRERNTDTPEVIEARLAWAEKELSSKNNFHYQLINQDLLTCFTVIKTIVDAEIELHKRMNERLQPHPFH